MNAVVEQRRHNSDYIKARLILPRCGYYYRVEFFILYSK